MEWYNPVNASTLEVTALTLQNAMTSGISDANGYASATATVTTVFPSGLAQTMFDSS